MAHPVPVRARGVFAAVAVASVLTGCVASGSDAGVVDDVVGGGPTGATVRTGAIAPDLVASHQTVVDGVERTWTSYAPDGPHHPDAPVLLLIHGSGGSGVGLRDAVGPAVERVADRHGFTVVYVDGHRGNWNECRRQGRWPAKDLGVDDVGFMHEVVASLGARGPVFAVGFSSGGHMAMRLALEAPDLVDGVAAVAASPPVPGNQSCDLGGDPVPVMLVEGRDDPINPVHGGEVRVASGPTEGTRGRVMSAADGAAWFARHNGVAPTPPPVPRRDAAVTTTTWAGANPVRLVVLDHVGHTFPTAAGGWGPDGGVRYDAIGEIWRFLDGA